MVECGLTNLSSCLPQKFFEYVSQILNTAIEPLLNQINQMLTQPIDISLFHPLWSIMIYVISLFYGIFFLFAGVNFMVSGYDAAKREKAKEWMKNVILMILFVNASYLIYELLIEFASLFSAGVISLIPADFFLPLAQNFNDIGVNMLSVFTYNIALLTTFLLLGIRYIVVVVGVALFPFAIFFYFIPPLRNVGKMIFNVLLASIFIVCIDAVLLLATSQISALPAFETSKMSIAASGYMLVNLIMLLVLAFAILRAVFSAKRVAAGGMLLAGMRYMQRRQQVDVKIEDKSQRKLTQY